MKLQQYIQWNIILNDLKNQGEGKYYKYFEDELELLTSIIGNFGVLPITEYDFEFAIEYNDKEMLTISINAKMFDILFDSNGITFYNNHTNVSKVVLNIEDLRQFLQK
jgi:hypothetical protein